jgi:molybdopterin-guanine dinucleotide biosynthesis protein A
MPPESSEPAGARLSGVVLAGGSARRMSGVDKTLIEVGGRRLLDGVLAVLVAADPIVVVGPRRSITREVLWTREDPPGSGPLAGLTAGLATLPRESAARVAVLAADLAAVTPATVARLAAACGDAVDGAVLVDAGGSRQWLIGVWWARALHSAVPTGAANRSVRSVLGTLRVREVPERPGESHDIDTPEDIPTE